MPADIILASVSAAVLFIVVGAAAAWLARRPVAVAWFILALIVLDAAKMEPIAFKFGILLYPEDIFFLILGLSCLARLALVTTWKAVPTPWWIIGAVQLGLFLWGYAVHGTAAGVDYRTHFYLWVAVAYFCSVKWTEAQINRIANAWILCAVCLCLVVYYRWIASATDPVFAQKMAALDTTGVRFRVIGSGATLMIAIASLIILFRTMVGRSPLIQQLLLPAFLLTIVVLQHRSVWVSLAVGIAFFLWALQRKAKGGGGKAIVGVLLIVIPMALFFVIQDQRSGVLASVKTSAGQAVSTEEGTMVSRVTNWQQLVTKWANSKNVATYLVGKPYGSGYNPVESEDGALVIDMVPHNHFVHMLYRGGLLGLLATFYLFYRLWKYAVKHIGSEDRRWSPLFVALFAALMAFYIPYWPTYAHGLLIGVAISYLGVVRKRRRWVIQHHTQFMQNTVSG